MCGIVLENATGENDYMINGVYKKTGTDSFRFFSKVGSNGIIQEKHCYSSKGGHWEIRGDYWGYRYAAQTTTAGLLHPAAQAVGWEVKVRDPENDKRQYGRPPRSNHPPYNQLGGSEDGHYTELAYKYVDQPVAAYAIYANSSVTLQTLAGDTYNVNFGQLFSNDGGFYEPNFDLDFRQLAAQQYPAVFGAGVSDSKVVVGYRRRLCAPCLWCFWDSCGDNCAEKCGGTGGYLCCFPTSCTTYRRFPKLATVTKPALLTPWSLVPPQRTPDRPPHVPGVVSTHVLDGPNTIFVGGLLTGTDELRAQEVKAILGKCGELRAFHLVMDNATGNSKGFCFCEFVDPMVTELCIQTLNGMEIGGKAWQVQRPNKDSTKRPGGGLLPNVAPDADTVNWTPEKRAHYGYNVDTGIVHTVREMLQFSVKLNQPWSVVFDHQGGGGSGGGGNDRDNRPIRDQPRRLLSQSNI